MKILAADSFKGSRTSLNAISTNIVTNGDICLVRIQNGVSTYNPAIYYFEYIENDGTNENLPDVVNPLGNIPVDSGSRWRLKDIYTKRVIADEVITSLISNTFPVEPTDSFISINDDGLTINNGQLTIESDIEEPPLIVNSSELVENLNAQYLDGYTINDFMFKSTSYSIPIPNDVRSFSVYFVDPPETIDYNVFVTIENTGDVIPSIYSYVITEKELDHFTIVFSGIIDSNNYTLSYFIVNT